MARYFIEIAYKGTAYSGWQIQHNALSVQQKTEEVLSVILRENISITGSGRTDAGVHARQQFAHFDTAQTLSNRHVYRFNALLPSDISIRQCVAVRPDAHARFDAVRRSYAYYIHQHKDPFLQGFSYHFHAPLDLEEMNRAAQWLVSLAKHDYACFSKSGHQSPTYDCHIFLAQWHVIEEGRLVFRITANRFLRGMVRAVVGTMLEIGTHKIAFQAFCDIIESRNRSRAGRSVEACGLYLNEVTYPETIFL